MTKRPANSLKGKIIGDGWKVIDFDNGTESEEDGKYSTCYKVQKENEFAFLKAIDIYEPVLKVTGNKFHEINKITQRALNEKEIASLCTKFRMKHVVRCYETGEIELEEFGGMGTVQFLIYELADESINKKISSFGKSISELSLFERIKIMHNVANALRSMHTQNLAHQDIKPSNILSFKENNGKSIFKLGDFDCAIKRTHLTLEEELKKQDDKYVGTFSWAPIELLYGHIDTDWNIVRKGTDFYLLGSLMTFLITGRGMTELIKSKLHRNLLWEREENKGNYTILVDKIEEAFQLALSDIASQIEITEFKEEFIQILIKLCHPNPRMRGEIKRFATKQRTFELIKIVSKLGILMAKSKFK